LCEGRWVGKSEKAEEENKEMKNFSCQGAYHHKANSFEFINTICRSLKSSAISQKASYIVDNRIHEIFI
jgi:hypothetical protein